jgi:hypothetical protein
MTDDQALGAAVLHVIAQLRTFRLSLGAARQDVVDLGDPRAAALVDALDAIVGGSGHPGALDVADREFGGLLQDVRRRLADAIPPAPRRLRDLDSHPLSTPPPAHSPDGAPI